MISLSLITILFLLAQCSKESRQRNADGLRYVKHFQKPHYHYWVLVDQKRKCERKAFILAHTRCIMTWATSVHLDHIKNYWFYVMYLMLDHPLHFTDHCFTWCFESWVTFPDYDYFNFIDAFFWEMRECIFWCEANYKIFVPDIFVWISECGLTRVEAGLTRVDSGGIYLVSLQSPVARGIIVFLSIATTSSYSSSAWSFHDLSLDVSSGDTGDRTSSTEW